MTIIVSNGALVTDSEGNTTVVGTNNSTWEDLTSWDEWRSWTPSPTTELRWLTEPIDLQRPEYFNIEITADIAGSAQYRVYTSMTGEFAGEETETVIDENAEDIEGYYGRYAMIGIVVTFDSSQGIPQIRSFNWKATGERLNLLINDAYSLDLPGDSAGRVIELPRTVSRVVNIQLTPHVLSGYVTTGYWETGYAPETGLAAGGIVSKNRSDIRVAFTSEGSFTESVFDAVVTCLPQQYRDGKNVTFK